MEIHEGSVDYNVKDDMGQAISKEAAVHMSKYRVRCKDCSDTFCSDCGIQPYHLGKTCDAFKQHQNAKKCRFCDDEIGVRSKKDVCKKKECKALDD